MVEPVQNQIIKILPTAKELYNRLVLVVGQSGSGKTTVLSDVAKEYTDIVTVAEKIPNKILEEDPKLLMWYDQSVTRIGGE